MPSRFTPGCCRCRDPIPPSAPSGTCPICDSFINDLATANFYGLSLNLSGWAFPPLNDDHQLDLVINDDPHSLQWTKTFCSLGVLDADCFDAGEPFPQYQYTVTFFIKFATSRIGVECPNTIRYRCYLRVTLTYHEDASTTCSWMCLFVLRNGNWVLYESTNSGDCAEVDPEAQPACGTFTFYPPGECIYQWFSSGGWINVVGVIRTAEEICGDADCTVECIPPLDDGTEEGEYGQGNTECDCPCCECLWQWTTFPENWVFVSQSETPCPNGCDCVINNMQPTFNGSFEGEMAITCCEF